METNIISLWGQHIYWAQGTAGLVPVPAEGSGIRAVSGEVQVILFNDNSVWASRASGSSGACAVCTPDGEWLALGTELGLTCLLPDAWVLKEVQKVLKAFGFKSQTPNSQREPDKFPTITREVFEANEATYHGHGPFQAQQELSRKMSEALNPMIAPLPEGSLEAFNNGVIEEIGVTIANPNGVVRGTFVDPLAAEFTLRLPIDTEGPEPRTDARSLHTSLGSKQKFADWFDQRKDECDLVKDQDFGINRNFTNNSGRGRPTIDYWLTLDAAKEMAMLERNEQGKKIRRYLIAVEKEFRKQAEAATPKLTMAALCQAYLEKEEQLKLAISTTEVVAAEKDREIDKLASKVETPTKGITLKQFAKETASTLGYTSRTIYQYLLDTGVFVKEPNGPWGDAYVPSSEWDRSGYFQIGRPHYDRPTGQMVPGEPALPEMVMVHTKVTKLTRDVVDTSGTITRQGGFSWLLNRMLKDDRTTLSRMCADTGGAKGKYSKLYGCRLFRCPNKAGIMDSKADPSIIHFYKGKWEGITVWGVGRHIGDGKVIHTEECTLEAALERLCELTPKTAPKALGQDQ